MTLIKDIDYGAPASGSETIVTFTIDGKQLTAPEGSTKFVSKSVRSLQISTAPPSRREDG